MIALLKPAELLLRGVNRLRRKLYQLGVVKSRRLPRPVISVGNITLGGAGKTPTVIAIARDLTRRGMRVAVLTRGYGRSSNESGVITSSDAARWGDEPVMIKNSVANLDVIVGSKRYDNAIQYLAVNDCDVFVLDDGFQHLQLARDIDVVVEAQGPRLLREGRSALRNASFVIARRLKLTGAGQIAGKRVYAFSGLADNEQFFATLRDSGATLVGTSSFRDHHPYSEADVAAIRAAASESGAELIVTTEKDAVKLPNASDLVAVGIEMEIDSSVLDAIAEAVLRGRLL